MKRQSTSQTGQALLCLRQWYYDRVVKIPRVEKSSQALGTEVHALLEGHLKGYATPLVGSESADIARTMLPFVPRGRILAPPESYRTRERWHGYIDLEFEASPGVVGVSDHKTRGSLSRFIPTSEELSEDLQATVYTYLVAGVYGLQPSDTVALWWTYGQTKRPYRALNVRSSLQVAVAEDRIAQLDQTIVAETDALRLAKPGPDAVRPNPLACSKFGGCPHREICNLSPIQKLQTLGKDMSDPTVWQRIAAASQSQAPVAAPPAPQVPQAPVAAPPAIGGPYTGVNRPSEQVQGFRLPQPVEAALQAPVQTPPVQAPPVQAPAPQVQAPPVQAPAPQVQAPQAPAPQAQAPQAPGFVLLIDCFSDGALSLATLIQGAHETVKAAFNTPHYLAMEYGAGRAPFTVAFFEDLDSRDLSGLWLHLDTRMEESALILSGLLTRAERVVQGAR